MTDDQPRTDANSREHDFTLTIEEAADRYATAGHPRTIRAIQKYCARGDLECQKAETPYGQRYLVTPASVARHVAQIIDVSQAHGREQPRTDAAVRPLQTSQPQAPGDDATVREQPRPNTPDFQGRYLEHLEHENKFLREQNTVLLERVKETNILTGRLQEMLTPLLGTSDRRDPITPVSHGEGSPPQDQSDVHSSPQP